MKVKLPKIYDLGCNDKAKVIESADRKTQYLMSYETIIAFKRMRGCGATVIFRTMDDLTMTSLKHCQAFVAQFTSGCSDLFGKKGYLSCEKATVEE